MLSYIIYLIIIGISSWIFKMIAGLFESLSMAIFGLYRGGLEKNILTKPKRFFAVLVVKNTIIGLAHSWLILFVTSYMFLNYDVNYWLYIITAVIWSLAILQYAGITPWVYFFSSTINLVLILMGYTFAPSLILVLCIVISLSYHFGRINMYKQQISVSEYQE